MTCGWLLHNNEAGNRTKPLFLQNAGRKGKSPISFFLNLFLKKLLYAPSQFNGWQVA